MERNGRPGSTNPKSPNFCRALVSGPAVVLHTSTGGLVVPTFVPGAGLWHLKFGALIAIRSLTTLSVRITT